MGFFDTLKVMKDIVAGGIEAYNAGEKLDELIEQTVSKHRAALTDDECALHKQFKRSARAYDDNSDSDKNDALLQKPEDDRLAFLDAVANNPSLPQMLRDEIKTAVVDFKRAENVHSTALARPTKNKPRPTKTHQNSQSYRRT